MDLDVPICQPPAQPGLPRRTILFACFWGMMLLSLSTVVPAMGAPSIVEAFGLDYTRCGIFVSAPFVAVTITMLFVGHLADLFGFRVPLVISGLCEAGAMILIAVAPTFWAAVGGAFLAGVGAGIADGLLTPIVCSIYPDRRTTMCNLLHAFYPIGVLFNVALMMLLMHLGLTWRGVFGVLAALPWPFIAALLMLPLPRHTHSGSTRLPVRQLLRQKPLRLLGLGIFLVGVTEMGPSQWLPAFIEQTSSGGRMQGGLAILLFGAAMTLNRLSASAIVHRRGARRLIVVSCLVCAVSLGAASLPMMPTAATIAALTVLGFAGASVWPTILGTAGDHFPQAGAAMFSLLAALGNLGGVVGPMTIGVVADRLGLHAGMAALILAPLGCALAVMAGLRRRAA